MAVEFNGQSLAYKYLFRADYKDSESYYQGSEDKSLQEDGKNAFFDIFYKPIKPIADLIRFNMVSDTHTYTVDLTDGHFEIDGIAFRLHEEDFLKDFRLVFFRRHLHHSVNGEFVGHDIIYFIGWQTTIDGKNYQETINFD